MQFPTEKKKNHCKNLIGLVDIAIKFLQMNLPEFNCLWLKPSHSSSLPPEHNLTEFFCFTSVGNVRLRQLEN